MVVEDRKGGRSEIELGWNYGRAQAGLWEEMGRFFAAGVSPVAVEETVEMLRFLEAAERSWMRGEGAGLATGQTAVG
jgi:hypothetical protein